MSLDYGRREVILDVYLILFQSFERVCRFQLCCGDPSSGFASRFADFLLLVLVVWQGVEGVGFHWKMGQEVSTCHRQRTILALMCDVIPLDAVERNWMTFS